MEIPDEVVNNLVEVSKGLPKALEQLQKIEKQITETNNKLGFTARTEEFKSEIKIYGWDNIKSRKDPSIAGNKNDPVAVAEWNLYLFCKEIIEREGK
jgi:hypothetical protein